MMTMSDLEVLLSEPVRRAVEDNLDRRPTDIALDGRIAHAARVATQVKYLQRAREKLPAMYSARCILPPLAFEQSSSEACAARKPLCGGRVLDLTCGLGVDAAALARRFAQVVAVERDATLAAVARENFSRLGIDNVAVVEDSAEHFVAACGERFDWIFVAPDRRSAEGRKLVRMEDCSPDIIALMPALRRLAPRVAVKCSPLFDCDEAFRLFSPCTVEVVSLGGECKEVDIYTGAECDTLRAVALGLGEESFSRDELHCAVSGESFAGGLWRYMITPDVALQKSRAALRSLSGIAEMWSRDGYAFCRELPGRAVLGRIDRIVSIERYRPRELRREYRGAGVEVLKRDCRLSVEAIRRAAGLREGGDVRLAFTTIGGETWVIRLEQLSDRL